MMLHWKLVGRSSRQRERWKGGRLVRERNVEIRKPFLVSRRCGYGGKWKCWMEERLSDVEEKF